VLDMAQPPVLPLLRLLQAADSAFPVGGFAYSHGLETLVATGAVASEDGLADILRRYVQQPLRRQVLPAARAAHAAPSPPRLLAVDGAFDRSLTLPGERTASRAMGRRLLDLAPEIDPQFADHPYRRAVRNDEAPGHYPVALAALCRSFAIPAPETLAAVGIRALDALVSAATRLGVIGPSAGARLVAGAAPALAAAIDEVLAEPVRLRFGSWFPALEIAAARHPALPFRMFAT
jgi:urease accessory protein